MDWFEQLTGFAESSYSAVRARLTVDGDQLGTDAIDHTFGIGTLETPMLGELRDFVLAEVGRGGGRLTVRNVTGDAGALHNAEANEHALFQVASQFNLLEMVGPEVTPEDGVTRYSHDLTQGPACAMAAGAATIYRNYLVPVGGECGQTRDRQIDCLEDLGGELGNADEGLWSMRNGYAMCSEGGLTEIDRKLERLDEPAIAKLRDLVRIGIHWNVEVTGERDPDGRPRHVSQAFCSALPVAYSPVPSHCWKRFACLVLEAAYEATLLAGLVNARRYGSRRVLLTSLGGGAFGNDRGWIHSAMHRALRLVADDALDVHIVSHRDIHPELERLASGFPSA